MAAKACLDLEVMEKGKNKKIKRRVSEWENKGRSVAQRALGTLARYVKNEICAGYFVRQGYCTISAALVGKIRAKYRSDI